MRNLVLQNYSAALTRIFGKQGKRHNEDGGNNIWKLLSRLRDSLEEIINWFASL